MCCCVFKELACMQYQPAIQYDNKLKKCWSRQQVSKHTAKLVLWSPAVNCQFKILPTGYTCYSNSITGDR